MSAKNAHAADEHDRLTSEMRIQMDAAKQSNVLKLRKLQDERTALETKVQELTKVNRRVALAQGCIHLVEQELSSAQNAAKASERELAVAQQLAERLTRKEEERAVASLNAQRLAQEQQVALKS